MVKGYGETKQTLISLIEDGFYDVSYFQNCLNMTRAGIYFHLRELEEAGYVVSVYKKTSGVPGMIKKYYPGIKLRGIKIKG